MKKVKLYSSDYERGVFTEKEVREKAEKEVNCDNNYVLDLLRYSFPPEEIWQMLSEESKKKLQEIAIADYISDNYDEREFNREDLGL